MSWNRIRLLIWKEFTQLRRDRSMLPILFIMPIVMLLMFGYVVGSDIKNIQLAVLDSDHSVQSQQVVDSFVNSTYFTVNARPTNEAQLKQALDGGQAVLALDIPKGFSD